MKSATLPLFALLLASGCSSIRTDNRALTRVERVTAFPMPERPEGTYPEDSEPEWPSYQELKSLIDDRTLPEESPLKKKLDQVWTTPVVNNQAWRAGNRPQIKHNPVLGPFIRVAQWNIEKSLRIPDAVKTVRSEADYLSLVNTNVVPVGSETWDVMRYQRERLVSADIILLQEMDIGVPRSGYLDGTAELARAFGMNYAYGTQYLEIDPVLMGLEAAKSTKAGPATAPIAVDEARYVGAFGSGLLSRFPIRSVELFPLKNQPHDWYEGEKARHGLLEAGRRTGSKLLFHNDITRELKLGGGRHYLRVDLDVPGLPEDTLTVIVVHLEIKCPPKMRDAQVKEILGYIKGIGHPVIMAGDFNSAPSDISNTSTFKVARKAATNPTNWMSFLLNVTTTIGTGFGQGRWAFNLVKNFHSPLATHVPVVAPNPVRPMFNRIGRFTFDDGGSFDFRGDRRRTINGRGGILANSNQHDVKGHATTFTVRRPIGPVGVFRLDWMLVKSFLDEPRPRKGSYRFAPHYGETLKEFNKFLVHPLSDHRPCIIDLPLEEPPGPGPKRKSP